MPLEANHKKLAVFLASGIIFLLVVFAIAPPIGFPSNSIVEVKAGTGLHALSLELERQEVIRSPFWFRAASIVAGGERTMKAGQYYMSRPENALTLAWRIWRGEYRIAVRKITIPEGFTGEKIDTLFGQEFTLFNHVEFKRLAPEGYLFPDTYFIPITATASSTVKLLHDNFIRKIFPLMPDVESSGRTLEEIVTMASIIEAEANNQTDREMVSDVLWKRLKIGMPLQVDAEAKTYEFQGLPSQPINNPGLLSIQAALHPVKTPYLYYLTGTDRKMHYAKTFDEHKDNIAKYLH